MGQNFLKKFSTGLEYGLKAMLGWGVFFIFIDKLVSDFGWFLPVFFVKTLMVFYALAYSGIARKNISFPKNVAVFVIIAGVLEAIAFLSMGFSISSVHAAITAPIIAAYPAITIILARIFFKEILEINQKIGVVAVLTGLVLLAV